MTRSWALLWCAIFAFWIGISWAHLDAGAALMVFVAGTVGWGLGRTWTT